MTSELIENEKDEIYQSSKDTVKQPSSFTKILDNVRWSLDLLAFARQSEFAEEAGTLNPENRIARLSRYDGGFYIRPEFKYTNKNFGIWIKPRVNLDIVDNTSNQSGEDDFEAEFFFQELKLRWYINQSSYLIAGRYLKNIGSSVFINPSNPFFIDPGRLNPKFEIRPMDFVEYNYSKNSWSFSAMVNFHEGQTPIFQEPFFEFKRRYALFAEYYGDSDNLGAILSMDEDERVHFGYYGQKNVSEAVVAWIDGSVEYNPNRFYPVTGNSTGLIAYDMVNGPDNEKVFFTALAGASYTFKIGPTLQLEYYYNGKGYDDEEFDLFQEVIASSVDYNFGVTRVLSDRNLGRGINTGMPYIRRHYIFSQLGQNDVFDQLNFNFRYFYALDDNSSQFSSLIEWNVTPELELHSVILKNFGKRASDFNRFLDHQIMVGLLYKF
ncbi:hypothetical protein [Ascidiimonas sp. W6]|uniref:hypothetical protein n=1 Tax=Ascidiimonas meishanensis TaxID=3128903 RepID=UPI0030EC3286